VKTAPAGYHTVSDSVKQYPDGKKPQNDPLFQTIKRNSLMIVPRIEKMRKSLD
jgi:hypothetical protein